MLYTVKEVAERLKVNRNMVYQLIKSGELVAIKVGSIKVSDEALRNFIERREKCASIVNQ